jgi:hypothetical protein
MTGDRARLDGLTVRDRPIPGGQSLHAPFDESHCDIDRGDVSLFVGVREDLF